MKLSFSSLGCPGWSYERILEEAVKDGFSGVEVRGISGEMRADKIDCFAIGRQRLARTMAEDKGIRLIGFGSSARFHDPAEKQNALDDAKAAIDVAYALGMKFVRVFGDRIAPDEDENIIIDRVAEGINELCLYARGSNVLILQETHGDFNHAHRILGVAERVNHDNFGIIWDVAHTDKIYGNDFMPFYSAIKDYIRHVHFKDHKRKDGSFSLCNTGDGDIPLLPILEQLKKDRYDGYISLEWEKTWHPQLRDAEEEFPHFIEYIGKAIQ